jgi:hypothetical protein
VRALIYILAALMCWTAQAGMKNAFGSFESAMTSDDLKQRRYSIGAVSDRSDILWPYKEEREQGTAWGLGFERFDGTGRLVNERPDYRIERPYLLVNHKISNLWSFEADLGWFHYTVKSPSHSGSELTGWVRTTWKASDELNMNLTLGRQSMLQDLMLLSELTDPTLYNSIRWQASYTFFQIYKLQQIFEQRWVADGNERWASDTSFMYALSQYPVWFWLGFGFNALGFDERNTNYWTPKSVRSFGPRLELAYPVKGDLFLKAGGSVSTLQEEDFDQATASYLRAGVQYGARESKNAELMWTDIRSERNASTWSEQILGLNVNWPF